MDLTKINFKFFAKTLVVTLSILLYSSVFAGKINFALTLEPLLIPGYHLKQNDSKILLALYQANGKEWFINDFLMGNRDVKVGFGDDNLLVVEANLKEGDYDLTLDFIYNIKRGLDLLAKNNDTLYVSGQYLNIDIELFQTDSIYQKDRIYTFYENSDSAFNFLEKPVKVVFGGGSKSKTDICVQFNPLVRFINLYNNVIETKYLQMCDSLNMSRIGRYGDSGAIPSHNEYDLYTNYLIEACSIKVKNFEPIDFFILPISYDGAKCIGIFKSNNKIAEDNVHPYKKGGFNSEYCIAGNILITLLIIFLLIIIFYKKRIL